LEPDSGDAEVFAEPMNESLKNKIGYMPDEHRLYKRLPAIDQILYFSFLKGMDHSTAAEKADQLLRETGMLENIGTGGVISTRFTLQDGNNETILSPEKKIRWLKYHQLYRQKMLSKADYLNLYDIVFDKPESHVISKGDTLYYAFYQESWDDLIECTPVIEPD
jgi:hypothetical protein